MVDQLTQTNKAAFCKCEKPLLPMSHVLVDEGRGRLLETLCSYLTEDEVDLVSQACYFADDAHINDKRKSGEPYVTHPIAVARILADYQVDADTLIAALLHDTIEDTAVSKDQIIELFNHDVAEIVDGVTKLKNSNNKALNKAATFSKILTATLNDPRVIIVKLADRLHNMSTMSAVRVEKRVSTAKETLDFYIPFARIMGLNVIADQLELLCYENLDEEQFNFFLSQLAQRKLIRQHRQSQISQYFYNKLNHLGLSGKVHNTDNRLDLFRTFFKHKIEVELLLNRYEFTVELPSVSACDALFRYVKNRFNISNEQIKDYIRKPYPGGYQALIMQYQVDNELIQLTIQTHTMYQASRYGALLGTDAPLNNQNTLKASLKNLHELVNNDCAQSTVDALMDYFADAKILVLSPKGEMLELPVNATVLDFAYALNNQLGHTAVSARVDGKPVTLATKLETGQEIYIETTNNGTPNPEWLGFVTTVKARQAIQSWLKQQSDADQVSAGEASLVRTAKDRNIDLKRVHADKWQAIFDWQNTDNKKTIFQRIATGDLLPQLVIIKLFSDKVSANPINCISKANNNNTTVIAGTKGIQLHYASCCNPILGDKILGEITSNGMAVHRYRCYSMLAIQKKDPTHVLPLTWNDPHTHEEFQKNLPEPMFSVVLNINTVCSEDTISQVILRLLEVNAVVNDIYCTDKETLAYIMVTSRNHVAQIMRELRVLLGFPSVQRLYRY